MVERRSALAHLAADLREAGGDAVTLAEQPFLAQVDVRLAPEAAAEAAVASVIGVGLPVVPGTTSRGPECSALWLGPDEWLVVGLPGTEDRLCARLSDALGGGLGAVVDVSANRTVIEISGARAREVLEKGCSIDLHPRAFAPGRCAQTLLARAQVVLEQTTDEPAYRLFVRPSFAGYLAAWLIDAAMEFRAEGSARRASVERRQRSVPATSLNV
jgi:sarcosine oxidase subunit gamma